MQNRVQRLRQRMQKLNLTDFLISSKTHLRYLFGFTGSNGMGLVTRDRCLLITDQRYKDQARIEVKDAEIFIVFQDLLEPLKELQLFNKSTRLGFEASDLSFKEFSRLREAFKDIKLVSTVNLIERITLEKFPEEVDKTRTACDISRQVWQRVVEKIRPGITELELSAEISYQNRKLGAEGDAFEPIVASGWRSALPHGTATRKKLERGELVVIDFGSTFEGYKSDITRTIVLGEPTPEQKHIYESVKTANQKAMAAVRAGMKAIDLDGVARTFLKQQGYEKAFSHSLGHGLGLDVHSLPRIGPRSEDIIPLNSIITIEPGVYDPQVGGVRIEDDVYVHQQGTELLTHIDRELLIIE